MAIPNVDEQDYVNFHVWGIFDEKAGLLNIILMDEEKQQNEFSIQPMGGFGVMISQIGQFLENLRIEAGKFVYDDSAPSEKSESEAEPAQ